MSLVSTETPVFFVKARTIGRNDSVASAGASSVHVHMIVDVLVSISLSAGMLCEAGSGSPMGAGGTGRLCEAKIRSVVYTRSTHPDVSMRGVQECTDPRLLLCRVNRWPQSLSYIRRSSRSGALTRSGRWWSSWRPSSVCRPGRLDGDRCPAGPPVGGAGAFRAGRRLPGARLHHLP